MQSKWIKGSAVAVSALLLVAMSVEQAAAQRGGREGGPGGQSAGPRSMGPSGGPRVGREGPSGGPRVDGPRGSTRNFTRDGSRTYSYAPRYDRRDRDGRRHVRRFRGDRFFLYGAPLYGAYAYGPCAYYYERAISTGSEYWWDRYYACTGNDYD
jgi:hypothetical protein